MNERIEAAQAEIDANLAPLRLTALSGGDASGLSLAEAQSLGLAKLQQRVAQADGTSLVAIRAEVTAVTAAVQLVAQQARASAAAQTAQAVEGARRTVQNFVDDYYEKKIFDPYLVFASAEDERAFREREEARRKAIEAARTDGTPEGAHRALKLSREQLLDAGAHGADKSPDYQPMLDRIAGSEAGLSAAISDSGTFRASSPDPLDAVPPSKAKADPRLGIRAAGVTVSDADQVEHGVSMQMASRLAAQGRVT